MGGCDHRQECQECHKHVISRIWGVRGMCEGGRPVCACVVLSESEVGMSA